MTVYEDIDFFTGQPYPMWARARVDAPVARFEGMMDSGPTYHVTRHADAEAVLRDPVTFSSSINGDTMAEFMGEFIMGMDGAEHKKYRALVSHAFRASALARWEEDVIRPTINIILDDLEGHTAADLVSEVTTRFPGRVICAIVGIPVVDHEQFFAWAESITMGPIDPPAGLAASQAMSAYLAPIIASRRERPEGDLLSELLTAEVDGERLTEEKIYGFLRLLLPAGAETTSRLLGSVLTVLLTRPDVLADVRANRALIGPVIEETLRWETSVTTVARVVTSDTVIAGCPVAAGSAVSIHTGSANHDEARYDDPESWKLGRASRSHLAFGWGPHLCLGMHLARLELTVAINALLDRFPFARLDPSAPEPEIQGLVFRGPNVLPVLLGGAASRGGR